MQEFAADPAGGNMSTKTLLTYEEFLELPEPEAGY